MPRLSGSAQLPSISLVSALSPFIRASLHETVVPALHSDFSRRVWRTGRHELALAETAAAAKAIAGAADWETTALEHAALVPTAEAIKEQRRRLAGIVSAYATSSSCSDDAEDSPGDRSNPSPSFFVHGSALFYRMVLSGGSELPRKLSLTPGLGHRLRVHVRLMSEYNRFRRSDLQSHLPLSLSARFLKSTPEIKLEVGRQRSHDDCRHGGAVRQSGVGSPDVYGLVDGSGRGALDLVLYPADTSNLHNCTNTVTIEIEIFVQGAASAQVLPVLTPMICVNIPSSHHGARAGSSRSDSSDLVVDPTVDDAILQLDGTRAGTRHVLPVPTLAGDQPLTQSVEPPGLYITELTGAHVRAAVQIISALCSSHSLSYFVCCSPGGLPCVGLWISHTAASLAEGASCTRVGEWLARSRVGMRLRNLCFWEA